MSPEILTKIGEYELREKLGQGGYGAVYKARDSLGRDVAIKILTGFGDDAPTINIFKKEASTLAKLQHPNIVTVYQFGLDNNGRPYLAMEYVQGQPLSVLIRAHRELHLVEKLDIILQATEGLKHAHENNVIHRDIKPHNLMVVESPEKSLVVKLIDFGIAQGEASKSQSQSIAGSLPYMSPEHFVQRRTPWCDVFSMGVVLYELLTEGIVPYASDRDELPVAYGKLMSNEPALPISHYIPDLPPGLEEVVAKVINKKKLSGYETAEEFLYELSRVQDTVKAQFVNERLAEVDAAVHNQEATQAFELVSRVLRVDPKNPAANRKKFELKKLIEEARRNQQVRAICVRVEGAIQERQFDAAHKSLEEARQLDPGSPTVAQLQQKLADIRRLQERINSLVMAAQEHGKSGRWEDASSAIREAAALDRSNTNVLKFQAEIERRVAQEHGLLEQARSLLHEQRFREASGVIRELEAMAPRSERVVALKELAVREHREYIRRTEIAAYQEEAQHLVSQGNLSLARTRLDEGIAKYPDERSLLDLRASVEQQQEELARRQFVDEKLQAGVQFIRSRNYIDAIALLEQARLRVPDPALETLLVEAKEKAKEQAAEKLREQYLKSARESLAREDAASAVVTLEMAQSEFGAADTQIQSLLEEARYTAERQARHAAERQRLQAERQAHETAEREEINAALVKARAAAHEGDFNSGLKLVEQAAVKFGMRQELSVAANEIKAARTAEATAKIEAIIQHAITEAEGQHYPLALEAIERGKEFAEFASPTVLAKLRSAEQRVRKAEQDYTQQLRRAAQEQEEQRRKAEQAQGSATVFFGHDPSLESPTIRQDDARTTVLPAAASSAAAAASPARARAREAESEQPAAPTIRRSQFQTDEETAPPSPKKWIAIGAAAAVVILAVVGYLIFGTSSAVQVRFETEPAGAQVSVNGQSCSAPCGLKLKPGHYSVRATHDQFNSLDQPVEVTSQTGTIPLTLVAESAPISTPPPPPAVGTLVLDINVPGADIFVDNQLKDTARKRQDTLKLEAGHHDIRVVANGYQPGEKPVDIATDAKTSISFKLEKGPGSQQQPQLTFVSVLSQPNAVVSIDSQTKGRIGGDGKFSSQIDPGKHTITASLDGYSPASRTINAKEGDRANVRLDLAPIAPMITSFSADATEIQEGKSASLKWETQNAGNVIIDGVGTFGGSGSTKVTPNSTTTYSLVAVGAAGNKSTAQRLTIKVAAAPAAPAAPKAPSITRFELGSDSIKQGDKVKIFWDAQNADSVTIEPEGGTQKPSGSMLVSPSKTTTFTLIAKGPGGTANSQPQTLTVVAPTPTPAPVSPPPAPSPSPTTSGASDADQIKQLIEQRYRTDFENANFDDLKVIFPKMPKSTDEAIRGAKGMIKLALTCMPDVSGATAIASCSQSIILNGRPLKGNVVTFTLSKASGAWQILNSK